MKRWKLSILLVFLMLAIATSVDTRASSSQVQLNPICGRWLIVQVYAGAFTFPAKAILPDGAANPYIVYGGPDLVVDNYYCIYDPVVELISPSDRTKEGYSISQKITGWSTIQPAGSQPPSAEFDAWPQSGSAPLSVSMHIVSTNNISGCLWEYGDGTTGTSCDPYHDHVYSSAGSYTVKLTVTGPGGSNTMTRSNYITVTAAAVCYTLTKSVNPSNSGSIIAFPIPNCADGKYAAGTQLSLVATSLSGYQFTSWGGSLSGNANPATLIMDAYKNVTANFNQSSFCSAVTEIPQTECEALIAFYNSTNGAGWSDNSNWLDTTSPCNWYGVTCNNNHVVQLVLPNNQLNGTLPEQLNALTNLQTLSLYVNQLSGSIPPAVGSLTNLISLSLSDNQLSGSIPASLGSLSNLQLLHAHGNQFSGTIPTQLEYLTNLRELDLAKNQLSGSIPTQIGNLTKLEKLGLGSNQLSGNIPPEIAKLTKLVGINLSNNQLSGNLPVQVGDLINLDFLSIENNLLNGALPDSLINLNKLVHFWFNNTNLCEPGDNSFQSWLTRISDLNRTGVTCTVASPTPTQTNTPTKTPSPTLTPTSTPNSTVDSGFRPNPNGYNFPNYSSFYLPYSNGDYSYSDMELMFGSDAVCSVKIGSICIPKREAIRWHKEVNSAMSGGHCYGMAVESLRFFKNLDQPSLYQNGSKTTFDLTKDNAKRRIAYFFVEQFTEPAWSYIRQNLKNTPTAILNQLRFALQTASDPPILAIRAPNKQGGHAITPYKIELHDNGVFWVYVYDNNYPSDASRYVIIDTVADTWSYDLGDGLGVWSGNSTTQSLGLAPVSLHSEIIGTCPWCNNINQRETDTSLLQLWSNGNGNLLITDEQGRRIGFSNNQFIDEIPNAYSHAVLGGLTADTEPIYLLPLSGNYTVLLDGNPFTQAKRMEVTQFGPGYAVSVDDVVLNPATQDQLTITSDGTQIMYHVGESKAVTLSLALEVSNYSTQFQLQEVDLDTNQTVRAMVDTTRGKLVFSNVQAGGGEYNLKIDRASAAGVQTFIHSTLVILAGDTQYANYGAWNGVDSIVLEVDHGSDGTIDQTIDLNNEVKEIYLPIIVVNR